MASSNIDIIINADDKTKAAFDSASRGVSGFQKEIDRLKPSIQRVTAAAAVGFAALTYGVKQALTEAIEANKVQAQLGAVLESTGGIAGVTAEKANELADALAKVTLFEDDAIVSGENMLLTFTNIGQKVFPDAIKTALDMSTALGQDLQSSTMQLGKALNNPIDGISALTRVGVTFTDEQKNMITRMVEAGDVMGAQKVILGELTKEFGGSAEAAAKADPFGMMAKSIGELKEEIGKALLPAFTQLQTALAPIIEKFTEWAKQHPELLSKLILIGGAILGIVTVLGILATFVIPTVIAAFALLFSPIGMLIAVAAILILKWGAFKQMFIDLWESIKGAVKGAVDAIMGFLQPVFDFITKIIDGINKAVDAVKNKLSIGGGGKKKKVNDAVINPSGDVISTHPDDYLIATQNPAGLLGGAGGGNIIINMNGGTYLDDGVAQDIGDKIMRQLQLNMRGA